MFDAQAIEKLTQSEAITAANNSVIDSPARDKAVALPDGFKLHNLEDFSDFRYRARGVFTTASILDLAGYVKAHGEAGATIFVDAETMTAKAVLNLGTISLPGHADNLAKLALPKTAALQALLKVHDRPLGQAQTAEWMEDWADHLSAFGPHEDDDDKQAAPITLRKAIGAIRRITVDAMRKLESEEQSLSAQRSTFESVTVSSKDTLPALLYFKCEPYPGLRERQFVLRVGVSTPGDKPAITLRILKLETAQEEMAQELCQLIAKAAEDTPTLIGTYTRAA